MLNGGLFLLILLMTWIFVFSKLDFSNALSELKAFNPRFLVLALLSVTVMLSFETLTVKRNLRISGENRSFISCVKYTFAGNFFSAITPAATGGQPMQVYLMSRDNIESGKGTLVLMMDLAMYQISIVSLALVGFLLFFKKIVSLSENFFLLFLLGILLNIGLLILTLLALFSKKLIYSAVSFLSGILRRLKYKKTPEFETAALNWVEKYRQSAAVMKSNPRDMIFNLILMLIRITLMFTFPIWVYKGLGLSGDSLLYLFALQAALHISCAALPLPGGTGVGEAGFLVCFSTVFPSAVLGSAMLLSRIIGFYSVVCLSGLAMLFWYIFKGRRTFAAYQRGR